MDHLDREIAEAFTEQSAQQGPGRILVVGGSARLQSDLAAKHPEKLKSLKQQLERQKKLDP